MSKYGSNDDYEEYSGKRNTEKDDNPSGDAENDENNPAAQKAAERVRELLAEKLNIDPNQYPLAYKLIDQEISKIQSSGRIAKPEVKYVDIYREKPIKVTVKVLVPVKEHPKFNFVGKLLGPKGNSMKRLQEETMCKMAILGKGSMRDRQKEEELRASLDPKYAHLSDELHIEISALGPPAEAHARISFALAEVRKYLIPDNNDNIRQEQMREMESMTSSDPNMDDRPSRRPMMRGFLNKIDSHPKSSAIPRPPPIMRTATRTPVITRPVMPAKTKIMSILDRARIAMEESYGLYEDSYDSPEPMYDYRPTSSAPRASGYSSSSHYDDYATSDYFRDIGGYQSGYARPPNSKTNGKVKL